MLRSLAGILATQTLRALALLSPKILYAMGSPLLPLYALFQNRLRRRLDLLVAQTNLILTSPLPYYQTRLQLAAHSLRHLTGHFNDLPLHIEGVEHYRSALETGKPVALLGWHQGPVELLHQIPFLTSGDRPFFVLASRGFSPRLSRMMQEGRRRKGKKILEPGALGLRFWIRKNGILAVMIDQVPGLPKHWIPLWDGACRIPFPGRIWNFFKTHNTEMVPVSVRLGGQSIHFRYHPPIRPANMTEDLQSLLEKSISNFPNQYNWSYSKIQIK